MQKDLSKVSITNIFNEEKEKLWKREHSGGKPLINCVGKGSGRRANGEDKITWK